VGVEAQHSPIGGSTAARVLACPGSVGLIDKVPAELRKESSLYADEGSALHIAMMMLLTGEVDQPGSFAGRAIVLSSGVAIEITAELVCDCLEPCWDFFHTELRDVEGFWVETRAPFPGIENCFGTCDLFGIGDRRNVLVDWKFGAGVGVSATTSQGRTNPQLLFYDRILREAAPKYFRSTITEQSFADARLHEIPTHAYIVQPRAQDEVGRVSKAIITQRDSDGFDMLLRAAADEAQGANPRLAKGSHCRFCPAKPICPQHTGPLLDLTGLQLPARSNNNNGYADALAAGLTLAEIAEPLIRDIRSQAHAWLESGGAIDGWKLVPKRVTRRWLIGAESTLLAEGFPEDVVYAQRELRSVAQAEKAAKPLGLAIPSHLVVKEAVGSTLARDDDARAALPDRRDAVRVFSQALTALEVPHGTQ
jgi:Protein of unknown function (DUF2800)